MAAKGTKGAAKAPTTGQHASEAAGLEAGKNGQDAQSNTEQAAADAAAATSSPASAAPEASVGDAAAAAVLAAGTGDVLDDDGEVEGLWITAVPEQGFRRCGFRFTREGLGIALSALTEQQIEQLEREPNLKVERGMFSGLVA